MLYLVGYILECQIQISLSKLNLSYLTKHMRYEPRALIVNDPLFCLLGILQCLCDPYINTLRTGDAGLRF
jgi:hypothetical protein